MSDIRLVADSNIRIRPVFQLIPTPPPVAVPTPPPITPPPIFPSPTPSVSLTPAASQTPGASRTPAASQTPAASVTPSITTTPGASVTPSVSLTPVPSVTPSVSRTPSPSQTPAASGTPAASRTPAASVTPSTTPQPSVTPSVSQIYWRSCVDGNLRPGVVPGDYVRRVYPLGGTCWEPGSEVGFEPELTKALEYEWRRGSLAMPEARSIKVTNPSFAATYALGLVSDPDVIITPNNFTVGPRESKTFVVNITQPLLNRLADGMTDLALRVELREL
jgi:hypothetical protein